MALALVATRGHAQPSAGHFCCPVGGYSGPLPDPRAASGPCYAAEWQPVCGSGGRHTNTGQCRINYLEAFSYAGQSPKVKQQIVDMAMNASGIRDTARGLHVSPTTVINELKKTRIAN